MRQTISMALLSIVFLSCGEMAFAKSSSYQRFVAEHQCAIERPEIAGVSDLNRVLSGIGDRWPALNTPQSIQVADCWCAEFKQICVSWFDNGLCRKWLNECIRNYCN